jgi:uncharacterized protein
MAWQPARETERYEAIDALRGAALFGVLMINLLGDFRISLFQHILEFHTDAGWANRLVDDLAAGLLEFKAFTLFSLLFGVGAAIQAERAAPRGVAVTPFLLRRFTVLLLIGLCHMLLIWNGDILALYGVCGLLLAPMIGLRAGPLAAIGAGLIALPNFVPIGIAWPSAAAMRAHAAEAARVYGDGSFAEIFAFRRYEAWKFILPLLVGSLPRTAGLMFCGAAVWRSGVLRRPQQRRDLLWRVQVTCGVIGGSVTMVNVFFQSSVGVRLLIPGWAVDPFGNIALALAYGAGFLLVVDRAPLLAAAGRMALTNYLAESVVFGFIFYGYGLGLFGRLGSAAAAVIGVGIYVAQLYASRWWLERFRFGPCEWLWRSVTYGRRQPMRRTYG